MKKLLLTVIITLSGLFNGLYARDFIVITREGKVFDQPNSKSYVTTNSRGEEVVVRPGMAFRLSDSKQGWDLVEYTPGLRGYVMQNIEARESSLEMPDTGVYEVSNKAGHKVTVSRDGDNWSLASDGDTLKGKSFGNVVIFADSFANPAYSLVKVNGKNIVASYDNSVTGFF